MQKHWWNLFLLSLLITAQGIRSEIIVDSFRQYFNFFNFWFSGGIREFKEKVCLPCDDRKIRNAHQDYLLEALTFFETEAEDTAVMARWIYIEELAVNNEFDVDI